MITLTIGDQAPDFSLVSDNKEIITLEKLKGKNIILYFYPKDNTPGCTKQACAFRDSIETFNNSDTVIIGISKDTPKSHQGFKQKHDLPFTLLSDENGDVCEAYGVLDKKSLFGKTFLGIQRSTFLIDKNGIIKKIWRKVKVSDHIPNVLESISQL